MDAVPIERLDDLRIRVRACGAKLSHTAHKHPD